MTMDLPVLKCGNCEPLKLGVHAAVLGLSALCCAYNAAAWLSRRQGHLVVNAVLYSVLAVWEQQHVAHHLAELRRLPETPPGAAEVNADREPPPCDKLAA
jgi:hypothetical protein